MKVGPLSFLAEDLLSAGMNNLTSTLQGEDAFEWPKITRNNSCIKALITNRHM